MIERMTPGPVCATIGVPREVVLRDAENYRRPSGFSDLNPYLSTHSAIADTLAQKDEAVLTARLSGGLVEAFVDGVPVNVCGGGLTEKTLAVVVNTLYGSKRVSVERADEIAKKVVRSGQSIQIKVRP